jgi:lipopolysaccharide export system protein LptC
MFLRLSIFLTFLIVSLILWYPAWQELPEIDTAQEADLVPEFTAKLLHQEMYDAQGKLKQEVFSKKMEHYADLSLTQFEQPEFIIYQDNQAFWKLSAQYGAMQDGLLTLNNQVTMLQLTDSLLVQSIATDYLEINLNSNLVTTDNPIKIEGTKLSIMGQGLRADLNLGKVTLTQHVKTIFKGND